MQHSPYPSSIRLQHSSQIWLLKFKIETIGTNITMNYMQRITKCFVFGLFIRAFCIFCPSYKKPLYQSNQTCIWSLGLIFKFDPTCPFLYVCLQQTFIYKSQTFNLGPPLLILGNGSKTKKIWNVPDLVVGWVWKSPFSRFKVIKKCSQIA